MKGVLLPTSLNNKDSVGGCVTLSAQTTWQDKSQDLMDPARWIMYFRAGIFNSYSFITCIHKAHQTQTIRDWENSGKLLLYDSP